MPNPFFCLTCGDKLNRWLRLDARFCSDYCRKRYYDIRSGRVDTETALNSLRDVVKR